MLPVIDLFREVPTLKLVSTEGATEREESMHKNFGSLANQILSAFEKFGFKEFSAGVDYADCDLSRYLDIL